MNFSLSDSLNILERTPRILKDLLDGLPSEWLNNNEGPDTWSPFDIVGHLIHGEKTDWIPRTKIILSDGDKNFEPFDRFAQFQESSGKSINELLVEFAGLRSENLRTINSMQLTEIDLKRTGVHPEFGKVTLKQLLSCWTAHDLGHLYQISRVMAKNYKEEVGPWEKYLRVIGD